MVAVGALAGLAIGAVVADRTGGLDGFLKRAGERRKKRRDTRLDDSVEYSRMTFAEGDPDDSHSLDESPGDEFRNHAEHEHVLHGNDDTESSIASEGHTQERGVPDDTELEERVLEAFHNDPVLAERAIDIGAIGTGVIELTGWVQASWEIGHAVTLARGVPDVTTVVDRLAVRDGERRRDHSGRHYSGEGVADTKATEESPTRAD